MPIYRKLDDRGYEMYKNNVDDKWYYTHRMVAYNHKSSERSIDEAWTRIKTHNKIDKHLVVHHVDFNKKNNELSNLHWMGENEHWDLHSKNMKTLFDYSKSEKGRNKSRELMKKLWANAEWKENRIKQNRINRMKGIETLKKENRCGFQSENKTTLSNRSKFYAIKNNSIKYVQTPEYQEKGIKTRKVKFIEDDDYKNMMINTAKKNINKYNQEIKNGDRIATVKQINARKNNGKNLTKNLSPEQRKLRSHKTVYKRWYQEEFKTFEEYYNDKGLHNHKVISVENYGTEDVYDITVDKYHNFALSSGVFAHNCAVGYDDSKNALLVRNSWGTDWGIGGYFWLPYEFVTQLNMSADYWTIRLVE